MKLGIIAIQLSLIGTGLAMVGCPGSLEDPSRFGQSLSQCQPKVEALFTKTCAVEGCHSTADRQGGLDLQAPDVPSRLVGVLSTNADCSGKALVDLANPDASLFYRKLLAPPPCGVRMPYLGKPLANSDIQCVRIWIESFHAAEGGVREGGATDAAMVNPADGNVSAL